ncbi:hypothetical protein [Cupriavidus oxalaticus]|jgi:hypothetical protein|uniref:Uncharacterized protein n=1 Tax=Cupriavidus oxalaticus TaxID=96344 RepID=A0A5P3VTN2_9BURK|nr:hypothetical protein [Cupriavidus oxalaticus]QEZ48802.1 hypothetical protein D2917_31495 [Cupriavidus oxalaticus]
MIIQSRSSGAAVLAIVAMLFVALYLIVTAPGGDLPQFKLLGCGLVVALIGILWLMHRLRSARRTRSLMKLVRAGWQ